MHGSRRLCLALALACSVLVAGGCSHLGAVREFAASSARITDYRVATEHYLDSADRQLTELPAAARFDGAREQLQALKQVTARDKATLLRLHATSTGYMHALAQLAGADAYSVSPEIGKVARAIETSEALGIEEDHVDAYDQRQRLADPTITWRLQSSLRSRMTGFGWSGVQ